VSAVKCLRGVLGPHPTLLRSSRVGPSGTSVQDAGRSEKSGGDQPPRAGDGHPERNVPGPTRIQALVGHGRQRALVLASAAQISQLTLLTP
jgi:hypothetical protein